MSNQNANQPTEIKCPHCLNGYLSAMTEEDRQRMMTKEGNDNYPEKIWGCDECKYWIEEEFVIGQD